METPAGDAVTISPGCLHNGRETQQFPRIIPRINQARKTAFLNLGKTINFFKKADTKHGGRLNVNRLSLWGASQRTESRKRLGIFEYLNSLAFFFSTPGLDGGGAAADPGQCEPPGDWTEALGKEKARPGTEQRLPFPAFPQHKRQQSPPGTHFQHGGKKKIPRNGPSGFKQEHPAVFKGFFFLVLLSPGMEGMS